MNNLQKATTVKSLQTRITKLKVTAEHQKRELTEAQNTYKKSIEALQKLDNELKSLQESKKDLVITEHAILRYLERGLGIKIEDVKKQILTDTEKVMIKNGGNGKYPVGDMGLKVVVKNNSVVSLI